MEHILGPLCWGLVHLLIAAHRAAKLPPPPPPITPEELQRRRDALRRLQVLMRLRPWRPALDPMGAQARKYGF